MWQPRVEEITGAFENDDFGKLLLKLYSNYTNYFFSAFLHRKNLVAAVWAQNARIARVLTRHALIKIYKHFADTMPRVHPRGTDRKQFPLTWGTRT